MDPVAETIDPEAETDRNPRKGNPIKIFLKDIVYLKLFYLGK